MKQRLLSKERELSAINFANFSGTVLKSWNQFQDSPRPEKSYNHNIITIPWSRNQPRRSRDLRALPLSSTAQRMVRRTISCACQWPFRTKFLTLFVQDVVQSANLSEKFHLGMTKQFLVRQLSSIGQRNVGLTFYTQYLQLQDSVCLAFPTQGYSRAGQMPQGSCLLDSTVLEVPCDKINDPRGMRDGFVRILGVLGLDQRP